MNVYEFIDSEAIRMHCKSLGHRFTALEAAYLIWQSRRHTVSEKHAAWRKLIETVPDCVIEARLNCPHFDSLHGFFRQYMELEQGLFKKFFEAEEDSVYRFDKMYLREFDSFSVSRLCEEQSFGYEDGEKLYFDFAVGLEAESRKVFDSLSHYRVIKQKVTLFPSEKMQKITITALPDLPSGIGNCITGL